MSNYTSTTLTSFTLNIISSILESITLLICLCFLFLIIRRLIYIKYRYVKVNVGVPIILSINTLCLLICKSVTQLVDVNLNTLTRDINRFIEQNDSFSCRFHGYAFFSIVSALYWSCALQAMFRVIRVVHPRCLWLQEPSIYLYVLIPGQIVFGFSSVLPHLLVFDGMRLIPDENYCTALMNDFPSLIYLFIMAFGLPLGSIGACYTCIIRKIRNSSLILPYRQRNRRDYIVIRRIMLIIIILSIASLPCIIDLIIYAPRGYLNPLIYRIEWISASINALIFAVTLPFINPQLRELFKKRQEYIKYIHRTYTRNRIVIVNH